MTEINWFVWWVVGCGLAFNGWLVWNLAKVSGHLIYTAVAAASFTRFCWACGKVHGFKGRKFPSWVYAPQVWFGFFAVSLGAAPGSINHMGGAGVWSGIGKWTVYPAKETEPCA